LACQYSLLAFDFFYHYNIGLLNPYHLYSQLPTFRYSYLSIYP